MDEPIISVVDSQSRLPENRSVIVVAGRVVEVETIHAGKSVWVATGRVSEPLPTGPFLRSPVEITATGHTEESAVNALCRRVEHISAHRAG